MSIGLTVAQLRWRSVAVLRVDGGRALRSVVLVLYFGSWCLVNRYNVGGAICGALPKRMKAMYPDG